MLSFPLSLALIGVGTVGVSVAWFYGLGPIGPAFNRVVDTYLLPRVNANYITTAGLPLALAACYYLEQGEYKLGFVCWFASWLCDFIDGKVARRFGFVSKFGELLDPVIDCARCYFIYSCFVRLGVGKQWMVDVMLMRDIFASGLLRQLAGVHGKRMPARWSGKLKAVLQFIGGLLIIPLIWWGEAGAMHFASNIMLVVTIATALSGLEYMWAGYQEGLYQGFRGEHK